MKHLLFIVMTTNPKIIISILIAAVGATAVGITTYWYVSQQQIQAQQQQIQAQIDISHREQCVAQAEAFKQRAMDAIARGQFQSFEEWKNAFQTEAQSLGAQCGDVLNPNNY